MGSDSITSAAAAAAFSREMGKKKRANRYAKLKQCKLDARREQWLSQVKNKGGEDSNTGSSPPPSLHETNEGNGSLGHLEMRASSGISVHESDVESPRDSLDSSNSDNVLRKDGPRTSTSSRSGSSGCFSGSVSEDEEGDGGPDDWEAVADAMTASDNRQHPHTETPVRTETAVEPGAPKEFPKNGCSVGILKPEWKRTLPRASTINNCRAWRPDDALRPQSLPNLSKQYTFPMNGERHCIRGGSQIWGRHNMSAQPSQCPICCEELDFTDSSFLPCSCGFRLCLFCHNRILEADGRCPGCRKHYSPVDGQMGVSGGTPPFRAARFCSMSSRS
ncbi:hypothetical protein AAC387_Pa03g0719 [Persea americana]